MPVIRISALALLLMPTLAWATEPASPTDLPWPTTFTASDGNGRPMLEIQEDGKVLIDWPEVERAAAGDRDPVGVSAVAQALLAVRDRKWEGFP